MILLDYEMNYKLFSSEKMMVRWLVNNEDEEMTLMMAKKFVDDKTVKTSYSSYTWGYFPVDDIDGL